MTERHNGWAVVVVVVGAVMLTLRVAGRLETMERKFTIACRADACTSTFCAQFPVSSGKKSIDVMPDVMRRCARV